MADYGLQRLIIRTKWENLEWVIHDFVGENYPSLKEFGLLEEGDPDLATLVQEEDVVGGIAYLKELLEKNAQTEWVPSFWHENSILTKSNGKQHSAGSFYIETYNERVLLSISYHHSSFWVDVRYDTPTLQHIKWYTKHKDDKDMKVWCVVVHPDKSESGLPLEDLPKMVRHWEYNHSMPIPKQYPFVGMGL
jgi:hypothetical protein